MVNEPKKFLNWGVNDGKLFHRIPNPLNEEVTREGNEWTYVVPQNLRAQIVSENHDSTAGAHQGINKTFERIHKYYFWPRMFFDIVEYVKLSPTCRKTEVGQQRAVGLLGGRILEYP